MTKVALEWLGLITPDSTVSYYILFLFLITGTYMIIHLFGKKNRMVSSYMIAYLGIIITTMLNTIYVPLRSGVLPFQIVLPPLIMYFAYKFFQSMPIRKFHAIIFLIMFTLLTMQVFQDIQTIVLMSTTEEFVTSTTFIILFLLPIALCYNNKYVKALSIIAVIIALLISSKRSSMISFSLGIVTYFLMTMTNLSRRKRLYVVLLFLIIAIPLGIYLSSALGDLYIFERMAGMSEDAGSGRDEVYKNVLALIFNSDLGGMVIGHGWDSVARKTGMPAHNDLFEIMYDSGWIVACLYLFFYYFLIRYVYRLYKEHSKYAGPMAASVVIFTIHSGVSHVMLYPEYMMAFALFWGVVAGDNSRMQTKLIRRR